MVKGISFVCLHLFLLFLVQPAEAQVSGSLSVGGEYSSNALNNYENQADAMQGMMLSLAHDTENDASALHLGYSGELSVYNRLAGRTYNNHALQLLYSASAAQRSSETEESEEDSTSDYFFLGVDLEQRFDHADYAEYDNRRGGGYIQYRPLLVGKWFVRLGLALTSRSYLNAEELSNFESRFAGSVGTIAAAATRLEAGIVFGYKKYTESTVPSAGMKMMGKRGGLGQGKFSKVRMTKFDSPSATQLVIGANLAHSLSEEEGVEVSYQRRTNPANTARYVTHQARLLARGDDPYDDSYGYQSHELGSSLSGELSSRVHCRLSLSLVRKLYNRQAEDLNGKLSTAARKDNIFAAEVDFGGAVELVGDFPVDAALSLGYSRNESNDEYSNAKGYSIALSITKEF